MRLDHGLSTGFTAQEIVNFNKMIGGLLLTKCVLLPLQLLIYGLLIMAGPVLGEDSCSLYLTVTNVSAEPVRSTWIELINSAGKVVLKKKIEGPETTICDFGGFGPHTLRVGTNECVPVTLSNLHAFPGHPIHVTALLNNCPVYPTAHLGCLTYFRFVDTGGKAVRAVEISSEGTHVRQSDDFGRAVVITGPNRNSVVSFKSAGYSDSETKVVCPISGNFEREIVMQPK